MRKRSIAYEFQKNVTVVKYWAIFWFIITGGTLFVSQNYLDTRVGSFVIITIMFIFSLPIGVGASVIIGVGFFWILKSYVNQSIYWVIFWASYWGIYWGVCLPFFWLLSSPRVSIVISPIIAFLIRSTGGVVGWLHCRRYFLRDDDNR